MPEKFKGHTETDHAETSAGQTQIINIPNCEHYTHYPPGSDSSKEYSGCHCVATHTGPRDMFLELTDEQAHKIYELLPDVLKA